VESAHRADKLAPERGRKCRPTMSRMKSLEDHGIAYDSAEYQNKTPQMMNCKSRAPLRKLVIIGDDYRDFRFNQEKFI